jgi:hypothetical protein
MGVGDGARTDLAQKGGKGDAKPVRVASIRMFSDPVTSDCHLQIFVERELDGDMGQSQKSRGEAGVERTNAFNLVHLPGGIPCARVLPWGSDAFAILLEALRHESRLDDPDGVGCNR